jgi:hypothetical protein
VVDHQPSSSLRVVDRNRPILSASWIINRPLLSASWTFDRSISHDGKKGLALAE